LVVIRSSSRPAGTIDLERLHLGVLVQAVKLNPVITAAGAE
jgi:hypothetical protein